VALRIEDYGFIGNCETGALVGRDGSIDWLALPRFDSPACFASLLGHPGNGRWRIAPRNADYAVKRRYRDDTVILETRFDAPEGSVTLTDFMPLPDAEQSRFETVSLVRLVRGERGILPMQFEAIFRFDYGRIIPWVRHQEHGLRAIAGADALMLWTPVNLEGRDMKTVADFTVAAGDVIPFVMTWYRSYQREPQPLDPLLALARTEAYWRQWSGSFEGAGEWDEPVRRSLLTLKALTYAPSGGIVAAPTTSLPERIGGVRNWDYRFCWLRDATFTLYAFLLSGYREEALAWREWLLRAVAGFPAEIQVMYGLRGERRLPEYELPWLDGYKGSAPVRIGNAAHLQRQTDVFGETIDAFYSAHLHGIQPADDARHVQEALLDHLEGQWQLPDSGIWEMRGPELRHTHSAVMAWVAFDRAVKAVESFGIGRDAERWRALRDRIHGEVCERGYDVERGVFVQSYGSSALDAALLRIPLVGFLPPDDPRVIRTAEAIARDLTVDGFVLRYRSDEAPDGLPAGEGTFLICSFWLADNLALMGRMREARDLFERLLAIRNDLGLLAEEFDPRARRFLGNFPQAFSHVGLINTAHNLTMPDGPADRRAGS
jgi:GH15 family glucan-1,4-alpha-glucosidase